MGRDEGALALSDAASAGESVSLRTLCEQLPPPSGSTRKRAITSISPWRSSRPRRSTKGVDPWQIVTADALLDCSGGAASPAFAEPAARKLARQGGTAQPAPALLGRKRPQELPPSGRRRGLNVCLMNDSFPPVVDGVANAVVNYAKILTETEGSAPWQRRSIRALWTITRSRRALSEHRHDEDDRYRAGKPVRPGSRGGACGDGL